jgi:hypothetical protein
MDVLSAQLLNPRSRTISVLWLAQNGLRGHRDKDHLGERVHRLGCSRAKVPAWRAGALFR